MISHIKSVRDTIAQAKSLVGDAEFTRRVQAAQYTDWPKRHATYQDDYYSECVANHVAMVALEVAREIIATT